VGFKLAADGQLRQIRNSIALLTANATGGASLSISPDGQFSAVTKRLANTIDTFRIKADGTLAPIVVNASLVRCSLSSFARQPETASRNRSFLVAICRVIMNQGIPRAGIRRLENGML
jgi:hypothetical protein